MTYRAWISTDRTDLETLTKSSDDFLDALFEKLEALKRHDFVAKEQTRFIQEVRISLEPGVVLIGGDFSENFSFLCQDAAQTITLNVKLNSFFLKY